MDLATWPSLNIWGFCGLWTQWRDKQSHPVPVITNIIVLLKLAYGKRKPLGVIKVFSWLWESTAPTPVSEVSTSIMNGISGLLAPWPWGGLSHISFIWAAVGMHGGWIGLIWALGSPLMCCHLGGLQAPGALGRPSALVLARLYSGVGVPGGPSPSCGGAVLGIRDGSQVPGALGSVLWLMRRLADLWWGQLSVASSHGAWAIYLVSPSSTAGMNARVSLGGVAPGVLCFSLSLSNCVSLLCPN